MKQIIEKFNIIVGHLQCREAKVTVDEEHRRVSIVLDDDVVRANLSTLVTSLDYIFNLILRREGKQSFVIDLNYYRKERERLIAELARAAAKRATMTKEDVELPPMNAYERRLVHVEIAAHPTLKTESAGEGKERRVVVKQIPE
ncbi:MAG: R3H domain-containing nucleic acid-binding protein [bacterium]|nr:R3H domain-containing nucleic acid-binding protein [bacterium]